MVSRGQQRETVSMDDLVLYVTECRAPWQQRRSPGMFEGVSANHGLLVARDMKRCRLRKWGFVVSVLESVDGRRVATRVLLRANSGWYCSIARGGIPEGCSRWNRSGPRCDEVERGRWCRRAWCNFRLFLRRCTDAAQAPPYPIWRRGTSCAKPTAPPSLHG